MEVPGGGGGSGEDVEVWIREGWGVASIDKTWKGGRAGGWGFTQVMGAMVGNRRCEEPIPFRSDVLAAEWTTKARAASHGYLNRQT